MKPKSTRSRRFVAVEEEYSGYGSELGAATSEAKAALIAIGFALNGLKEGVRGARYFVIDTKTSETKEYIVDRQGRTTIHDADPITEIKD